MSDNKLYALITIEVKERSGPGSGLYTEQQFHNFLRDVSNYLENRQMMNRDLIGTVTEVKKIEDNED